MSGHPVPHRPKDIALLSLGALGVVYGDIGTSVLYAVKECFGPEHGIEVRRESVLGILSLFVWSMLLAVVLKYLTFVMRADNQGEGGTFALLALLDPKKLERKTSGVVLLLLGIFGSALLCADGVITPAISVLGAVEGLGEATSALESFVVPISIAIIVALFLFQKHGTQRVASVFGPAMVVYFVTIAVIGLPWIARRPEILWCVNPAHAIGFMIRHKVHGFLVLGSVVLCLTGGEALYADMGHFGKRPIRAAWYAVVFPALLLNYFGQGALLLEKGAVPHPFFGLVEGMWRFPLVIVATVAAVIASQALISGSFSLASSAVQLGFFPRVTIKHTSGTSEGQIFVPEVNGALLVACVAVVAGFGSSTRLAAAYGIAVTGTMAITSVLFFSVIRHRWRWGAFASYGLVSLFLVVDLAFFSANLHKIASGGWVPLAIGGAVFAVMTTWRRGRRLLGESLAAQALPLDAFMADLEIVKPSRVSGTAVFMTSNPKGASPVLLHHFKHNKMLHQQIVLLSIATEHVPEVPTDERVVELTDLGQGFFLVRAVYGFLQTPNVLELLAQLRTKGLATNAADTSFYLGRETLVIASNKRMARWRKILFAFLSRNARPANAFFHIPPNRVVELGTQIEL